MKSLKNLISNMFIVTLLMIGHSMYSQKPDIMKGKNQTTVLSREKTIDLAKIVLNEQRQQAHIDSLEARLEKMSKLYDDLEKDYKNTVSALVQATNKIEETSNTADDLADDQLKKERNYWKGLHLYGQIQSEQFNLNSINFSLNLKYELRRFEVGIQPQLVKQIEKTEFNYLATIAYKIF